jgi:hypothetical protein
MWLCSCQAFLKVPQKAYVQLEHATTSDKWPHRMSIAIVGTLGRCEGHRRAKNAGYGAIKLLQGHSWQPENLTRPQWVEGGPPLCLEPPIKLPKFEHVQAS